MATSPSEITVSNGVATESARLKKKLNYNKNCDNRMWRATDLQYNIAKSTNLYGLDKKRFEKTRRSGTSAERFFLQRRTGLIVMVPKSTTEDENSIKLKIEVYVPESTQRSDGSGLATY